MDDKIRSVVTVVMIAGFGWLLLRAGLSKPHRRQRVVYGWCAALEILGAATITLGAKS